MGGVYAFLKPCFFPSFNLFNICFIGLTSPERPNSPKINVFSGNGFVKKEESIAEATAKSAAVSLILSPPTTFKYTSLLPKSIPQVFRLLQ